MHAQPLADSDTSLPSALNGTTGQLPHPRQPCLAILRNLARIVVAYNDHLREESYNHYIGQGRGVAGGFSSIAALDRRSHKPLHQQIYEAFCAALSNAISLQAKECRPVALWLSS